MADTVNSQIQDAIAQVNASLAGANSSVLTVAAYQAIVQAVTLGLQNAVAAQQQSYILRNALTSAAASALLDGKREEADAILAMAESKVVSPGISADIADLLAALKAIGEELRGLKYPVPETTPAGDTKTPPAG